MDIQLAQGEELKLRVREALQFSMMSSDKNVRDQSTEYLSSMTSNPVFFPILFEILNSKEYGEVQNLQAAIYLTKFIQTEYVKVEGSFKFELQEAVLQSFLNQESLKIRNQLRVGIMRLIITDFPHSKIFELLINSLTQERFIVMTSEQLNTITSLYYFVFKALYTDKHADHKLKQYIINYFNSKRDLFLALLNASFHKLASFSPFQSQHYTQMIQQIQNNVSVSAIRYALKFMNIENLLNSNVTLDMNTHVQHLTTLQQLIQSFCQQVDLTISVEGQEALFDFIHSLRQIGYSYHKYFQNLIREKRTTARDCLPVLEYLKNTYFVNTNHLVLNNDSFIHPQQLNDTALLSKLQAQPKLVQYFEDECNLVIQSLDICSEFIQVFGFKSVQHLFTHGSIEDTCNDESVIQSYFNQNYFQILLEFLLKKVLQLNWSQLAAIRVEPERAFSEDKGAEMNDIRGSGVNLLKVLMQNVNEEKMMDLLNELLLKYTSTICTGKGVYSEILEREAFYFIMNGLYKEIKNIFEFEDWYVSILSTELIIDDDTLIPLKVQILNLIFSYLQNSYQVPEETASSLYSTIATLMIDTNQSIYIRLMSMKCFVPLMESFGDLIVNVEQLMSGVSELFKECMENESKMLLLEFVQNLIDHMKESSSSELMKPIYDFLGSEWREACDNEDSSQLSLKARITQVLSQILVRNGLEISQIEFIGEVALSGTCIQELSEIYLVESSCRLMYFLTKQLNFKLSSEYLLSNQNLIKKKESLPFTPYEQALNEQTILKQQGEYLEKFQLSCVERITDIFLGKQNLFHTSLLILVELVNSPFERVGQAVASALTKGISSNLNEIKDEYFAFIFDALEYVQLVWPVSTASLIESALLILIGESVQKQLFNGSMKLYTLRVIGRAFFSDIAIGSSLCERITTQFSEPNFLHSLLSETSVILEQLKPEMYFYRMQYSAMFSVLQLLLRNSNCQTNNSNMIDAYLQQLEKILQILKSQYDKSLISDEHWIFINLTKLISFEDILEASDINLQSTSLLTKHLADDSLKKIDFASHSKLYFASNNFVPNIEIDFDKLSIQ